MSIIRDHKMFLVEELVERKDNRDFRKLAIECLAELQETLYCRSGNLVCLSDYDGTISNITTRDSLRYFLSNLEKPKMTKAERSEVLAHIAGNPYKTRGFRPLERVTTQPTFRRDFSLIGEGYDPETHLYYLPSPDLRGHVWRDRTRQPGAKKALETLLYPFLDFPWMDRASLTNFVAALITLVIRPAIDDVVPAFAIDGSNAASQNVGKGKLCQGMVSIGLDEDPAMTPVPPTPTQMIQTLTAQAKNGAAYFVFDNVTRLLKSDQLDSFLTVRAWTCKVPGTIQSFAVPINMLVIFTGNNLKMSMDLTNRVFWSELFHERTEERNVNDFRIYREHQMHFDGYIRAHRLELLDAVVTMILAWKHAGMPLRTPTSPLVKFGEWERIVGGILEFAGAEDFLENQKARTEAADDMGLIMAAFFAKLIEILPQCLVEAIPQHLVVKELLSGGRMENMLPEIVSKKEHGVSIALGNFIKSVHGRVFGGYKVMSKTGAHNVAHMWVQRVGSSTP